MGYTSLCWQRSIQSKLWFFRSHVRMWELYHKEGWCIRTVVLEKALESPLDSKIKPVNPKGNQPWIFTERTDAEAEAPILWPPDAKSWLIWKDPDAGKDWRQEEKNTVEDEIVSIIDSVDMNLSKLWEPVKDRDAWHAAVHGVSKSWTWLPREQSVSFRVPGFCLALFRLLCLNIGCLFIAKTLLFLPKALAAHVHHRLPCLGQGLTSLPGLRDQFT